MLQCGGTLRTRWSVREADTPGPTGCDFIDRKHPEQGIQRQEVNSWGPGAGKGTGQLLMWMGSLLD
jgi:hypothetical protein